MNTITHLQNTLANLSPYLKRSGKVGKEMTSLITNAIADTLREHGWVVEAEVEIPLQRSGQRENGEGYNYNGRVDLVATHPDGQKIAIEIDRTNKQWSTQKLQYCHQEFQMLPIWVRWRGKLMKNIPECIVVFDMTKPKMRTLHWADETAVSRILSWL